MGIFDSVDEDTDEVSQRNQADDSGTDGGGDTSDVPDIPDTSQEGVSGGFGGGTTQEDARDVPDIPDTSQEGFGSGTSGAGGGGGGGGGGGRDIPDTSQEGVSGEPSGGATQEEAKDVPDRPDTSQEGFGGEPVDQPTQEEARAVPDRPDTTADATTAQPDTGIEIGPEQPEAVEEQAREFRRQVVRENPRITDVSQVRVRREGDRLRAALTPEGREAAQRQIDIGVAFGQAGAVSPARRRVLQGSAFGQIGAAAETRFEQNVERAEEFLAADEPTDVGRQPNVQLDRAPEAQLERQLEEETGVQLQREDINVTRQGQNVTGRLSRQGQITVAQEQTPFQNVPVVSPVLEAGAKARVDIERFRQDVFTGIQERTPDVGVFAQGEGVESDLAADIEATRQDIAAELTAGAEQGAQVLTGTVSDVAAGARGTGVPGPSGARLEEQTETDVRDIDVGDITSASVEGAEGVVREGRRIQAAFSARNEFDVRDLMAGRTLEEAGGPGAEFAGGVSPVTSLTAPGAGGLKVARGAVGITALAAGAIAADELDVPEETFPSEVEASETIVRQELPVQEAEPGAELERPAGRTFPQELQPGVGVSETQLLRPEEIPDQEGGQVSGRQDTVVPGDFPLAGRDMPADPTREFVSGESGQAIAQATGAIQQGREQQPEITEEDILERGRPLREGRRRALGRQRIDPDAPTRPAQRRFRQAQEPQVQLDEDLQRQLERFGFRSLRQQEQIAQEQELELLERARQQELADADTMTDVATAPLEDEAQDTALDVRSRLDERLDQDQALDTDLDTQFQTRPLQATEQIVEPGQGFEPRPAFETPTETVTRPGFGEPPGFGLGTPIMTTTTQRTPDLPDLEPQVADKADDDEEEFLKRFESPVADPSEVLDGDG